MTAHQLRVLLKRYRRSEVPLMVAIYSGEDDVILVPLESMTMGVRCLLDGTQEVLILGGFKAMPS